MKNPPSPRSIPAVDLLELERMQRFGARVDIQPETLYERLQKMVVKLPKRDKNNKIMRDPNSNMPLMEYRSWPDILNDIYAAYDRVKQIAKNYFSVSDDIKDEQKQELQVIKEDTVQKINQATQTRSQPVRGRRRMTRRGSFSARQAKPQPAQRPVRTIQSTLGMSPIKEDIDLPAVPTRASQSMVQFGPRPRPRPREPLSKALSSVQEIAMTEDEQKQITLEQPDNVGVAVAMSVVETIDTMIIPATPRPVKQEQKSFENDPQDDMYTYNEFKRDTQDPEADIGYINARTFVEDPQYQQTQIYGWVTRYVMEEIPTEKDRKTTMDAFRRFVRAYRDRDAEEDPDYFLEDLIITFRGSGGSQTWLQPSETTINAITKSIITTLKNRGARVKKTSVKRRKPDTSISGTTPAPKRQQTRAMTPLQQKMRSALTELPISPIPVQEIKEDEPQEPEIKLYKADPIPAKPNNYYHLLAQAGLRRPVSGIIGPKYIELSELSDIWWKAFLEKLKIPRWNKSYLSFKNRNGYMTTARSAYSNIKNNKAHLMMMDKNNIKYKRSAGKET